MSTAVVSVVREAWVEVSVTIVITMVPKAWIELCVTVVVVCDSVVD